MGMIKQKERQIHGHIKKMSLLFNEADDSGDGRLTFKEFAEMVEDPRVNVWLKSMDINIADAKTVFYLIDDGDGRLTAEEVIRGFAKLKGPASAMDMCILMKGLGGNEKMLPHLFQP